MPTKTISRFLVLIMSGSYKLNIAKILEHTFYFSYIPVEKKREIQRQELEEKDIWGQVYQDKYYNKKGEDIVRINICWNTKIKNNSCQIWFVLEILLAKFPRDLQKVLRILFSPNWEYQLSLKLVMKE